MQTKVHKKSKLHQRMLLFDVGEMGAPIKETTDDAARPVIANITRDHLPALKSEENEEGANIIYYLSCKKEALLDSLGCIKGVKHCKIVVNLPCRYVSILPKVLQQQVSFIIAADRKKDSWLHHWNQAMAYSMYLDPCFHSCILYHYRHLHENQETRRKIRRTLQLKEKEAKNILSEAELRIFKLILEGKSNRKIAEECYLAIPTVNNHVSQITKKMQANDRTHTIKRAFELGWLHIAKEC
ncbi:response regulator transcription factor [Aliibacillus thermotolerans]|uniref:Response regulator transcription factor n=1 Tax=Aliibacillus thermotolerans TaxID=1834418 RepID=A0ABW0U869_9BACI|nr:LuxR C-terminal-related transcriptional regulator [Aliibacillus thermotolerans]MDA3130953.1 hypothetical protein [Aliibacillus thermotolerans]